MNIKSVELAMIARNYETACAGKSGRVQRVARAKFEELINTGTLLDEIRMYLLGNICDRFGIGSGYFRMQQRFSMARNGAQNVLESIAKELFLFYAVLVLGFTMSGIKSALQRNFTKEELTQLTVNIASLLRTEYFLYLEESVEGNAAVPFEMLRIGKEEH